MEILEYKNEFKEHIKKLNIEWLEKYFSIEPNDIVQLSDPENEIINKGGFIYYASVDNKIVGTVTLIKIENSIYELGKMAVTEKYQGTGIGRKLLEHCIAKAKSIGIDKLILYSNTKLVHAIKLYKKYGFVGSVMDKTHYKRANIKMELKIK
ncbi:MAG: GNAT family N-acetyltransferase [Bacteroidota bacterium]|jgi:GNAT superfamily N-acetyltransferase